MQIGVVKKRKEEGGKSYYGTLNLVGAIHSFAFRLHAWCFLTYTHPHYNQDRDGFEPVLLSALAIGAKSIREANSQCILFSRYLYIEF
jgi:hypothetical protein